MHEREIVNGKCLLGLINVALQEKKGYLDIYYGGINLYLPLVGLLSKSKFAGLINWKDQKLIIINWC